MRPALRPMSEARPMTSGEEERTSRRNSRRASRSPASALSETARSSSRRFLVSSEGSSAPGSGSGTSPLSFASAVAGRYQLGSGEDTRRLRELQDRGAEGFQTLQLRPFPRRPLPPRRSQATRYAFRLVLVLRSDSIPAFVTYVSARHPSRGRVRAFLLSPA